MSWWLWGVTAEHRAAASTGAEPNPVQGTKQKEEETQVRGFYKKKKKINLPSESQWGLSRTLPGTRGRHDNRKGDTLPFLTTWGARGGGQSQVTFSPIQRRGRDYFYGL